MNTLLADTTEKFVLDANVFIQAARGYYAFDIAPRFWEALIELATNSTVQSIDRVKAEIDRGKDLLTDWTDNSFGQWFDSTDEGDVIDVYRQVMGWGYEQGQFTDAAKAEFARQDNADAWLVAYAKAKERILVTEEKFDPSIRQKIKIPNVCEAFDVEYVGTFDMLRRLGVRLG